MAHPPCARWCRLAKLVEARYGYRKGEDGGCFASALRAVRAHGGVLEHPAWSDAWKHHGIAIPPRSGGWIRGGREGWTCCVFQRNYGHRARKATWLYAVGVELPDLRWGPGAAPTAWSSGGKGGRRVDGSRFDRAGVAVMCKRERAATPPAFRDLLIAMASSAGF